MSTSEDRPSLPIGTVTFLMTDIEGSTLLVGRLGTAWPRLLDDHFALMRTAVDDHEGTWISSEGDSVFAVFPTVRQAIGAAVQAQRDTATHEWPDGARPKVRMGIHAGEAVIGGRDYTGIDVHRTARLSAAGHGGQILVSEAAWALAPGAPAPGLSYRDLGTHQLRDLPAPERIRQLVGPDLEQDFGPLRTQASSVQTNLPAPPTRFVGRMREVGQVADLLQAERLVTLVGPGGTGKTRLAIETARRVLAEYGDGVWFVALEIVREPALVLPTIAATIGVLEQPGKPLAVGLAERLADKHALLVLDNFEQVSGAAPDIGRLLAAASRLVVLASSRQPLAIAGEAVYSVPPLTVPAEPGKPTAAQLEGLEAVDLFVDRATATRPDFGLTDANAPAIAAICRRLDGLPLAIELAAARANLLSPTQILARLDHRLTLLASTRRDLPERQRTLRGAIEWSHELLSPTEQACFRRFSAFSGGAALESLAPVLDPDGELGADILDLASALVDRSLMRSLAAGDENRLDMLETIREYATDQLVASGEERRIRNSHAAHFRELAEASRGVLIDPRRDEILAQLDRELPNLRAALAWSFDIGDIETGLSIAADLDDFWHSRGHLSEGRAALKLLLDARPTGPATALATRASIVAAGLAAWQVDFATAGVLGTEALRLAEELGDPALLIEAHARMGWATVGPAPALARKHFAEALELARGVGDDRLIRGALGGLSLALSNLGDVEGGLAVATETVELNERAGDLYNASFARFGIAQVKLQRGDIPGALAELLVSLRQFRTVGADLGSALAVDYGALIALRVGDVTRAVRLGAFADRLRRSVGGGTSTTISNMQPPLDQARPLMDPVDFDRAVADGEALDLDRAELEMLAVGVGPDAAPGRA
jgi:predicted ATPase/class 3 adenylate cyclase